MVRRLALVSATALALAACAGGADQANIVYKYPSPTLDGQTQWPTLQQDSIDWFNADQDGRDTNVLIGNAAPRDDKKSKK